MSREIARPFIGKVIFRGVIHLETGLHIGGSSESIQIGGIDNAVIINPVTKEPYIPGSSLKGKMRSVLEKRVAGERFPNSPWEFFNRNIGRGDFRIEIHVCNTAEEAAECPVCRVYGSTGDKNNNGSNFPSRLKVRDAFFPKYTVNWLREAETDLLFTEVKSENALDRVTSASNPRTVERVPAGADFVFEIVYDVERLDQLEDDLKNIIFSLSVIEDDALGGMGSRGYGKVRFYLSRVLARKAEFYRGEDNAEKIIFLNTDEDVSLDSTERPDYEQLKRVEDLKDELPGILDFFGGER